MSETRQDELEGTSMPREMLDGLASQLVLSDGSCPDPWIEEIGNILARISAMAELSGRSDMRNASVALEQQTARARRGEGDRNALEPALHAGLAQLREALDRAGTVPSDTETAPAAHARSALLSQDRELVSEFVLEAREHLASIEAQLLALEQKPGDLEPIHSIFRGFHTIKGVAGFLEFSAIQEVSREVETLLDLARNGRLAVTPAVIDAVLASSDYLGGEIARVEREMNGGAVTPAQENPALLEMIRGLMRDPAIDSTSEPTSASASADLGNLLQAVRGAEPPLPETEGRPSTQDGRSEKKPAAGAVKVDTAKLDYLVDMVGEMVIADSMLRHNPELAVLKSTGVLRVLTQLGRMTSEVQKTAMSMRMVTIGQLFQKMARLVRDLARKHGKQVELDTIGEDTELDRNIVEELGDPLMHMVRNAIDHGIESPEALPVAEAHSC